MQQDNIINEYHSIIKNKIAQGRFDSTKESIDKLIYYFPTNQYGYYYKGVCYYAQNKIREAANAYMQAIQINPAFAKAYFNLGTCFVVLRNYDQALINIGKALIIFSKTKEFDYRDKCIKAIKTIESER